MNETLYNSLPDNIKTLIDSLLYDEAFTETHSINEENAVSELFLEFYFEDNWQQLQQSKDILVKLCGELGELFENPFVKFTEKYIDLNKSVPSRNGYIALNNLYSKNIIDDNNLESLDEDNSAEKSILFNNKIYSESSKDIEFTITSYYWLTQQYNIGRMNLAAIASSDDSSMKQIAEVVSNADVSNVAIRNVIIYFITAATALQEGPTYTYDCRSANDIKNILKVASSGTTVAKNKDARLASLVNDINKLSKEDRDALYSVLGVGNR